MAKKFTLFLKAKVFANRVAQRKSAVLLARVIVLSAAAFTFPAKALRQIGGKRQKRRFAFFK